VTVGMTMLNTGMLRFECATELPSASRISQPKSCAAPMMVETAVRSTVVHMSSVMPINRLQITPRVIGSNVSRAAAGDVVVVAVMRRFPPIRV
jgi:hypothetical protein